MQNKKKLFVYIVLALFSILLFLPSIGSAAEPTENASAEYPENYFELKKTNPQLAQKKLATFLKENPNKQSAQLEMGYLLLQAKNPAAALPHFLTVQTLLPNDYNIAAQIGYIYAEQKKYQAALEQFKRASQSSDRKLQTQMQTAIKNVTAQLQPPATHAETTPRSASAILLDQYYKLKESDPCTAQQILAQAIQLKPCNVDLLKEMGYLLIKENNSSLALCYFLRAEKLDPCDSKLSMQIAYLLDKINRKREAYYQFNKTSYFCDPETLDKSRKAMINLAGMQTRFFCDPFFADLYFAPFYMDRFDDGIFPMQARFGVALGTEKQLELYGLAYFTQDTQSESGGTNPSIYSDNAVVYGVGARYKPFLKIPIFAYYEIGRAYYLVPQPGKPINQSDVRYGLTGYYDWGFNPTYANCLQFPLTQIGDIYGNFGYYSRYNQDWIGQIRIREGLKVAQYQYSSLHLYLKAQYFWDSRQYFYNNVVEIGPGVAFVPDNRWNLVLRLEAVRGFYIPVNSPEPNPYGTHYNNRLVELDTYFRF